MAVIGDRRTAAVVTRAAEIVWYCPGRFDRASVLAGLLDAAGGSWRIELPGAVPSGRRYLGGSGVLETTLQTRGGEVAVTDWLAMGEAPAGLLCRMISPASDMAEMRVSPCPDYARQTPQPVQRLGGIGIATGAVLYASHPLSIEGQEIVCRLPAGEAGWMILADVPLPAPPTGTDVAGWLAATLNAWWRITGDAREGAREDMPGRPYAREMTDSVRALRLMTHAESGGVIAAATTSLPEAPGGPRNYDYRYVWLRDSAMIVSAMIRAGDGGLSAEGFLGFVCATTGALADMPLPPFATLDGALAPAVEELPLAGYRGSRPVRIGNTARTQLQIDGFGNVLLAAKLIYGRSGGKRPHWETVRALADWLAEHWREPDHGLWEEGERLHYTSSKVIAACGLDSIAAFADDARQAARWRTAVHDIRAFVARECLTSEGAYASVAGGDDVDVSAALFPVWAYTAADAPEMLTTMAALDRDHSPDGLLYRRSLISDGAGREGAFLAGTFWVAQYWVMRGDLSRTRRIIDRALAFANDLGLLAEEADPASGAMLGNLPQTFVHAAFIGAVVDLRAAAEGGSPQQAEGE